MLTPSNGPRARSRTCEPTPLVFGPIVLRDKREGMIRFLVILWRRSLGQLHLLRWYRLVGNMVQQVSDYVQSRSPLVVRSHDEPRRPRCITRLEHLLSRPATSQ